MRRRSSIQYAFARHAFARRGIAPLELVMVLPLLAGLFFAMFSIVKASLSRMDAIESARLETWKKVPQTTTTKQLILNKPINDGQAQFVAAESVRIGGWWGGNYASESRNRTLAGTWDHSVVPFSPRQSAFLVHLTPFLQIADQARLGDVSKAALKLFAFGMNFPANPVFAVAGSVSQAMMPAVVVANTILRGLVPVLGIIRAVVGVFKWLATLARHRGLARFLGRVMNLLSLGQTAFTELHDASRKDEEVDWPEGGLNVGGAFP